MAPKVSEEYKKERKKELVETAKMVFVEKGFVHTSMQDIMDKAGISRGALYSYFDNIENVFLEVLKYDDQKDIQYFMPSDEGSIWMQLKKWVEEQRLYIERIDQTLLYARAEFFLSSNYANDKGNSPYIFERYNQIIKAIEEKLNEGKRKGEFRPQQSTRSIARYLISFINGLMLDTFQLGHEHTKIEEQLSVLLFTLEVLINPKPVNKE
ncbi:TetR family transcriptional regulator [Virgibacillus oceani]